MNVQEIRSFGGGEDISSADGAVAPSRPRRLQCLRSVLNGKLVATKGPSVIFTPGGGNVATLTRYVASINRLIYSKGGVVYSQDESAAFAPTNIGSTAGTTMFAQLETALVWSNSGGYPKVWRGTGTAVDAGIAAPTSSPTSASAGAGNLNSAGKAIPAYYWVYTFVDANGVESAPSPASLGLALNNQQATVLAIRVAAWDSRVTSVKWYRRGGTVNDYYYVSTSVVTVDTGSYPNTGASLTDNTRDIDIGTTLVPRYNARPPQNATILTAHNSRVWYTGIAASLKLYFSAIGNPELVATDQAALANDGGYLTLPGGLDDAPVCLSSTGSLLVIGRKRSVYALYGNNWSEFAFSQRSNVGVASKFGMVRGVNFVYFVGTDRRVYLLNDNDLVWISKDIQKDLDAMAQSVFDTCVLAFSDNQLVLSFGAAAADIAYVYLIPQTQGDVSSGWYEETGMRSLHMVGLAHPTANYNEFLFVTSNGNSISRAFADASTERACLYQSGEFFYPQGQSSAGGKTTISVYAARVEGLFSAVVKPSVVLGVGMIGDGVIASYGVQVSAGREAASFRAPGGYVGDYANIKVTGNFVPGNEISLAALTLLPVRSAF